MQYDVIEIRLSELITAYLGKPHKLPNEYVRIKTLMERGTWLREELGQADIVARLGIAAVRESRQQKTGDVRKPAKRVAYFVRSFKRLTVCTLTERVAGPFGRHCILA